MQALFFAIKSFYEFAKRKRVPQFSSDILGKGESVTCNTETSNWIFFTILEKEFVSLFFSKNLK